MDRVEKRTHSVYMYIGKSITESSLSLCILASVGVAWEQEQPPPRKDYYFFSSEEAQKKRSVTLFRLSCRDSHRTTSLAEACINFTLFCSTMLLLPKKERETQICTTSRCV